MSAQNTDFSREVTAAMQNSNKPTSTYESSTYERNHFTLLSILRGTDGSRMPERDEPQLTLRLERIFLDRATGARVPFEGEAGLEALLKALSQTWQVFETQSFEDHLMGIYGRMSLGNGYLVPLVISLGAGGQLVCKAGPCPSVESLLAVVEALDRQLHVEATKLGASYDLVAEGYNPAVSSPLDVALIPRARWTILNAHLGSTGRYGRDVMRCACSTGVSISHSGDHDAIQAFRLATALAPLLCFLTDNVRSFRGAGARRTQRMVRSVMWEDFDRTRCGMVPGTFDSNFTFETYLNWVESKQPILFEADDGTVLSTGKVVLSDFMRTRRLSRNEAAHLLHNVYPFARLTEHTLQISQADSLRPRMAAGYLTFLKGLLRNERSVAMALSAIGSIREADVADAMRSLRKFGWGATVYGQPVTTLVDKLVYLSRSSLVDPADLRILSGITELWEVRMVPRDAFVHQETKEVRGW